MQGEKKWVNFILGVYFHQGKHIITSKSGYELLSKTPILTATDSQKHVGDTTLDSSWTSYVNNSEDVVFQNTMIQGKNTKTFSFLSIIPDSDVLIQSILKKKVQQKFDVLELVRKNHWK